MAPAPALSATRPGIARIPSAWQPVAAWAVSRLLVFGLALAGAGAAGPPERGVVPEVPPALAWLGGWDTTWYLDIARNGYTHDVAAAGEQFTNLAFFPLVPAIGAAATAMGANPFLVILAASNLAFLGALAGLHRLTERMRGPALATPATWCLALAPPAVVASMAYTESFVLVLALGAALAATRGRFALAGAAAAAAALTRPPGIVVALLVGLLAYAEPRHRRARALLAGAAPAMVALAAFLAWFWLARGSPLLPFEAQRAWDRGTLGVGLVTTMPGELAAAIGAVVHLDVTAAWWATLRDLGFGVLYAVLLARLWRDEGGLRSPWVSYSTVALALPLASGSITSLARFGLMAFPLAWPAATWLSAGPPARRRWAIAAAVAVTVAFTALLAIRSP